MHRLRRLGHSACAAGTSGACPRCNRSRTRGAAAVSRALPSPCSTPALASVSVSNNERPLDRHQPSLGESTRVGMEHRAQVVDDDNETRGCISMTRGLHAANSWLHGRLLTLVFGSWIPYLNCRCPTCSPPPRLHSPLLSLISHLSSVISPLSSPQHPHLSLLFSRITRPLPHLCSLSLSLILPVTFPLDSVLFRSLANPR